MGENTLQEASTAALVGAQQFHRQLQFNASMASQRDRWWRRGIMALAITATVLVVLPCMVQSSANLAVVMQICQIGLVLLGLAFAVLVGTSRPLQDGQNWLILAAGTAATERVIYLYRTLLYQSSNRNLWLTQQVARIQEQVQERLGRDWILHSPSHETTDFERWEVFDLPAEGYLQQRLMPQLEQAAQQASQLSAVRDRYQGAIWICTGLVVVLPILSGNSAIWGAIAPTFGLAFLLWLRVAALNRWLKTYGQLALGLTLLRDHWQSLSASEQTSQAFFRLVIASEALIESPYRQVNDQVKESVDLLRENAQTPIQSILTPSMPIALEQELQMTPSANGAEPSVEAIELAAAVEAPSEAFSNSEQSQEPVASETAQPLPHPAPAPPVTQRGRPHAFVVMPFGRKQGPDGRWIDFNSIYQNLIKPAIEEAGFESFRADEEASSGDILADMFQELLLADLVVADLSIDNANVFYELGIRHALRRRGVVHIQAGRAYMPFDIFNVRTLVYHCDDSGCPDVQFVTKDKQSLVKMIHATWSSERNRTHSPIFSLLTGLPEPDRKALRTPLAEGYWKEYTTLQSLITIAQRQKRIGDVILLAEEVNNPLIKEDIIAEAGSALKSMGNSALALKQYRQGLKINPENVTFRCEEAHHLSRIGQYDEAIVKLEQLLQDIPNCVDATTYLARIYKDLWKQNWIAIEDESQRIRVAYEASFLLQKAIANYLRGYSLDQNQYYPGVNALTLTALLDHLSQSAQQDSGDSDEAAYRSKLSALKGSIRFCLESNLLKAPNDYWAALSLGDLAVCVAESPQQVATAYRKALAVLWNNKFALQATLDQLKLMRLLTFRPEFVQAGIAVLEAELKRFEQQERLFVHSDAAEMAKPTQVIMFTGHMIDRPDRPKPRFPAAMEAEAGERLEKSLDKLEAGSNSIAIAPGIACGGDILFLEACLKRNMRAEVYLPFEPTQFIRDSVNFAGDQWVERFYAILNHPNLTLHLQPERLGPVPVGDSPYRRNNRWTLYSTLMYDIRRVRLIALWNGQGGDGPGGTADMVQQVQQLGGIVEHIDVTKFDYWQKHTPPIEPIHHAMANSG